MNPFVHSYNNKRYHTLDYFYRKKFNSKIFKVSLNAGFSCPNLDGTVGYGGCIYCSKLGSGEFAGNINDSLIKQFAEVKTKLHNKWPQAKYIGYFQARTNTHAPLDVLKEKYEIILKQNNVVGLAIATRPDAITDDVINYLKQLNKESFITVELGLQTIHSCTTQLINRCHTLDCFEQIVYKLKQANINVVVHIINGLPYETKDMMLETINYLNKLPISGLKIHMLHILKNTKLAKMYNEKPFHVLTKDEYVNIVCDQLENLRPNIVIERITGDPKIDDLIEPKWLIKKFGVLNEIDKELLRRDTYQGFNLSILNKTRQIIRNHVKHNDLVVDATIGNGNDTLYLCQSVKNGFVFGFDIQTQAINNTNNLLVKNKIDNYQLLKENHANIKLRLQKYIGKISLIVFNLGYLPGSDKLIKTNFKTTIKAIKDSLELLNNKGVIIITVYPGHDEGKIESDNLKKYLQTLNHYKINYYYNTTNQSAPYLIEIKK